MIIDHHNNFQHILCYYTVIIKAYKFKYNRKILLFLEDRASIVYHRTYLIKKQYIIYNRLLESDQNCLRHGISAKPLLLLCKGDNTTKKYF